MSREAALGVAELRRPSKPAPRGVTWISTAAIEAYLRICFVTRTPPRVSELAQRLGVARGTLVTAVKETRGTTPAKYFRMKQVALAKKLLERGWTIERVAREAGYGTRRAFFRSFHEVTGVTPGAYRLERNVPRRRRPFRDRLQSTK